MTHEEFNRILARVPEALQSRAYGAEPVIPAPAEIAAWRFYLRGLWLSGLRLGESLALFWGGDPEGGPTDNALTLRIELNAARATAHVPAEFQKCVQPVTRNCSPEFAKLLLAVHECERRGRVFKLADTRGPRGYATASGLHPALDRPTDRRRSGARQAREAFDRSRASAGVSLPGISQHERRTHVMEVTFNKATMTRMIEFVEHGGELRPEGEAWTPSELMALAAACFHRVLHPSQRSRRLVAKVLELSPWDGTPRVLLPYKDCRELHGAVDWLMWMMRRQASGTFDRDFEGDVEARIWAVAKGVLAGDHDWPEVSVSKGSREGDRKRAAFAAEADEFRAGDPTQPPEPPAGGAA